ncbi:MAG: HesA/MoeB/ThiF family protein [Candidatus Gastranaerophilales bacterium]|nr:HesA/MoeB/ThiF family protein [Candidatus Gastranaerophilales bacterium]
MIKFDRYERNLEIGGITQEQQEKLITSKVLVMGVGGLGSGVVMNLAALGVGQIKVVDSEIIEESDFNRQLIHKYKNIGRAKVMSAKEWIQDYNPDIKVELDKIKINDLNYFNIVEGYDVIVDCFDSYESKYILNEIAHRHNKILIHGSMQGFCGQVTTIVPSKTGCLACIMQKPQEFKEEVVCSLSPVVSTISALQAQEVLKVLTGCGELLLNRMLVFDGYKSEFKTLPFSKNIACDVCNEENSIY